MYTKRALYLYIYIIFLFTPFSSLRLIRIVRKKKRYTLPLFPFLFPLFFLSLYTSLIIYKKTLPYLYNYTMIYVSTNARAPTVFVRVYRYRERLTLSLPSLFFLPPLNSPVITDINKGILYKTMYKFHSTRSPFNTVDDDSRALPFYIYAKVQNNSRLPSFFFL